RDMNGIYERTQIVTKMETPVTYFYTDKSQDVQVRVDMPKGLLTHWYPMVRSFGPVPATKSKQGAGGSFLDWRVRLIPHRPGLAREAGSFVPPLGRVKTTTPGASPARLMPPSSGRGRATSRTGMNTTSRNSCSTAAWAPLRRRCRFNRAAATI